MKGEKKMSLYPSEKEVLAEIYEHRRIQESCIRGITKKTLWFCLINIALFILSAVVFRCWWITIIPVIGILASLVALWPLPFSHNPHPKVLIKDYLFREPESTEEGTGSIAQISADIADAYSYNKKRTATRTWCQSIEIIAIALSAIAIFVKAVIL